MLVIPAIDIRCGKFVHLMLVRTHLELAEVEDPVKVAQWWENKGARMLQITDLDGSFTGSPENLDTIQEIAANIKIPLQVAGGIRNLRHIKEVLDIGAHRVMISANAIREPELIREACKNFGEQVAIAIEGKNDMVAIEGWNQTTDWTIKEMSRHLKELGVERVVFNDIKRYGSLRGPNLKVAREIAEDIGLKVIIAGGVSSQEDLEKLRELSTKGIEGVIVGKALYCGLINL